MKNIGGVFALLALVGCVAAPAQTITPVQEYALNSQTQAQLVAGLRDVLKDPDSAQISGVRVGMSPNGYLLACGWVNSKNSFGGYTGKQPFNGAIRADDRPMQVALIGSSQIEANAVLGVCRDAGIPIG